MIYSRCHVLKKKALKIIFSCTQKNIPFKKSFTFQKWLEKIIIGWIKLIYSSSNQFCASSTVSSPATGSVRFDQYLIGYKKQLAHFMYTHYAHTRIKRLFDIVIDFPDSRNAVEDLRLCLEKTNLRSHVIKSLKASIEQRLLHPGVNTSDVMLISSIENES